MQGCHKVLLLRGWASTKHVQDGSELLLSLTVTPDWITLLSIHLVSVINQWLSFLCQTRLTLLNLLVSYWEGGREKEEDGQTERWSNCINLVFLGEQTKDSLVGRASQRTAAHLHWYPPSPVCPSDDHQTLHNGMHSSFQNQHQNYRLFQKSYFLVVWRFFHYLKHVRVLSALQTCQKITLPSKA